MQRLQNQLHFATEFHNAESFPLFVLR